MPDRIRFHLDEHVPASVARALRRHGIDVSETVAAGLLSASDEEQLRFAAREGRVIFSRDADFLRLNLRTEDHAGIVYCHPTALPIGRIIDGLILIYEVLSPADMRGHVEFL